MITARRESLVYSAVVFLILVAALAFPKSARAASGNVQICQQNSTCTIGEFLYDDDYVPIPPANASCEISITDPSGTPLAGSPFATSEAADGWYSHDVVATGSVGLYRSTICCQAGTDYLCLDKSFEIATASSVLTKTDVADSVWNASTTSYTVSGSFGEALQNIVPSKDDIAIAVWGYSSRTLSGFGDLVSDVWENTTRTLTGAGLDSGSLATQSDVSSVKTDATTIKTDVTKVASDVASLKNNISNIKKTTDENRLLLEKVVNKPIIKNFLEEEKTPDLSQKIQETKTIATKLSIDAQRLQSSLELIRTKWTTLSQKEITDTLFQLLAHFGSENDTPSTDSLFGNIAWVKNKWEWQVGGQIFEETKSAKSSISQLQSEIKLYGKSQAAYSQVKNASSEVNKLSENIGASIDTRQDRTLFGRIQETQDFAQKLGLQTVEVDTLLMSFKSSDYMGLQSKINTITDKVSVLNRLSSQIQQSFFVDQKTISPEKQQKNQLLALRGILFANREFLARESNDPLASTWLEEGSIIFKSLVTNPSDLVSQTVPITLYLPAEVKKEDILNVEDGFSINFDADKKQLYVTGEITLAPSESKAVEVQVEDIWKISDQQIASLRKQADELYKPLVNTSYFGQAVTIKSDIDVALDKVLEMQKDTTTPEKKLRAYNEAQIELKGVKTKIDKLKELVALASSAGSLVGFVGGAQAIAVWGLIIIMVAGFVFLALYMRMIQINNGNHNGVFWAKEAITAGKKGSKRLSLLHGSDKPLPKLLPKKILRFALILITFGLITAGISGAVVYQLMTTRQLEKTVNKQGSLPAKNVLGESSTTSSSTAKEQGQKTQPRLAKIIVPEEGVVTLHKYPLANAAIVTKVKSSQEVKVLDESTNWVKVNLNLVEETESIYTVGWVDKEFIQQEKKEISKADVGIKTVLINQTPTGFLRVRETPGGVEIGQVTPGGTFPFAQEENGWAQIELKDGTFGWVSKEYVTISPRS